MLDAGLCIYSTKMQCGTGKREAMKYSVCIEMMFKEMPYEERFRAAAQCGFHAVEIWRWSRRNIKELKNIAKDQGVDIMLLNVDNTNEEISEQLWQGIVSCSSREAVIDSVKRTMDVCDYMGTSKAVVLSGNLQKGIPYEDQRAYLISVLQEASQIAAGSGVTLIFEPLNTYSRPDVLVSRAKDGFDILREVGSDAVKLLYDVYHQQLMEGNIIQTIKENISLTGHIQIADVPGRHEPGTGEINFDNVLSAIDATGYTEYVGMEYIPTGLTKDSFEFLKRRLSNEQT